MSRDIIHSEIDELLQKLSNHNSRLSLHTEKISQLDIDVLRKQCIDLYDQVNLLALKGRNVSRPLTNVAESQEPARITLPVAPDSVDMETPKPEVTQLVQVPVAETPKPEVPKSEPVAVEAPKAADKPIPKAEPAQPADVADTPKEEVAPFTMPKAPVHKPKPDDEMLSLFEKFSSQPIDSIPKAISLAKRFEFQNELFDGEATTYNRFMAELDNAASREDAFRIYHTAKAKYKWENEELRDELKVLMYRKYV